MTATYDYMYADYGAFLQQRRNQSHSTSNNEGVKEGLSELDQIDGQQTTRVTRSEKYIKTRLSTLA